MRPKHFGGQSEEGYQQRTPAEQRSAARRPPIVTDSHSSQSRKLP